MNAPWMVDAYTGSMSHDRDHEMCDWCREHFGDEAFPIHGRDGDWQRGGATIYGYTWFGFKTEEMMKQFMAVWPDPNVAVNHDL